MLNFALALAVTVRSVSLVTSWALGITMVIAAVLTAVGVPVTVILAWVSSVRVTLWLRPAGRLVIQSPDKELAKVSLVKVMFTSVAAMAVPVVPLTVTLPTAAAGEAIPV